MNFKRMCVLALVLSLSVACSDDETKTGESVVSIELGDDNKLVSELDADETCKATQEFSRGSLTAAERKRAECLFISGIFSQNAEGCQTFFDACLAQEDMSEPAQDDSCMYDYEGCDLTIGVVEACANSEREFMYALATRLTCEDLKGENSESLMAPSEACSQLSKCGGDEEACFADVDCPSGHVCEVDGCVLGCTVDSDCANNQTCEDRESYGKACLAGL